MNSEFLPNQFEFLGKKIFVAQNHPGAGDDNPGTPDAPFKTVSAAMKVLEMADRVFIDKGVYREEIPLPAHGHYYVPNSQVHFHAVDGKEVYIRGSDIFESGWKNMDSGAYRADLPVNLFSQGAYNPCELSLAIDDQQKVRPCENAEELPETLGQLYVDGMAYRQLRGLKDVRRIPRSFIVSADGKSVIAHFAEGQSPSKALIELTVRRRCINPLFEGTVMFQTHGIAIEHAAEPGPFCRCRPEALRKNSASGIEIRKTFSIPGAAGGGCNLMGGQSSYVTRDDDTIVASIVDDTKPIVHTKQEVVSVTSTDAGRTWTFDESTRKLLTQCDGYSYTFDQKSGVLLRHYRLYPYGPDIHGAFGNIQHHVMFDVSRDGGENWSEPELIDDRKSYFFSILPLDDGSFIWPYTFNSLPSEQGHHAKFRAMLGKWVGDTIEWEKGGEIEVSPTESDHGLDEPSLAQFPGGRLIAFFRQGFKLASQGQPGVPSVKLFSISADGGRSWTHPKPLTYEDGKYVYSPRAYHIAFRSIKNGRVYIIMNIAGGSCSGCDPRTHLYLVEVDPETLSAERNRITLVEGIHPEHHHLVRFSNFQVLQDRRSGNPLVFMKLAMSEYMPIWQGYDQSMYRYEIFLPE